MGDIGRIPGPRAENWEWQLFGACRGMDTAMFFHPASERDPAKSRRINQAKAVCNTCPVLTECRTHALQAREPYGIWGGMSEDERAAALGLRSMRYPAARVDPNRVDAVRVQNNADEELRAETG